MLDSLNSVYLFSLIINDSSINIYNTQVSVKFIYDTLLLITFLMTFCFISIYFNKNKKNLFQQYFVLMEFLINFPITLGVIGTLYSMSIAVASLSSNEKVSDVISLNFSSAVTTTIIGGLVYGYCFFLQAILSKHIIQLEHDKPKTPPSNTNYS